MYTVVSFIIILLASQFAEAKTTPVHEEVLADYVNEYVAQYYGDEDVRYRVELRRLPNLLNEIQPDHITGVRSNGRAPSGYSHFEVLVDSDVRSPRINFQAHIEVERKLPVPATRIESGSTLNPDDFRMAWVDVTRQSGSFLADPQKVKNRVAGRMLREGAPVRESELKTIPIILAGETATMFYLRDGLNIKIQTVARQDGAPGEQIRVHSERTRKTYIATVDPEGFLIWENTL